ncbi:MAG: PEP-CTERM sorting domain-containing protein [Arthrospira sp. PLM2.Bin9]|nr:PEP-CTERM sorting domain-containing protein [Arthrospira sp. PLM2.Bin9]TVU52635.1 MAG: PEP-CTERM sorting domain-containing protein [Arthrospira sp. PLM2.Bin9]
MAMTKLLANLTLASGMGLASALAFSLPAQSLVFYDLHFFDTEGQLVGTGEFSHEKHPFAGVINLCVNQLSCNIPLDISASDQFFQVTSFVSDVRGLSFEFLLNNPNNHQTYLFWRPFDDNLLSSVVPCRTRDCIGRRLFFMDNIWYDGIGRSEVSAGALMNATQWSSWLRGSRIPDFAWYSESGTWTATKRSVPEPGTIFGLMAVALVTGSLLKRKGDSIKPDDEPK